MIACRDCGRLCTKSDFYSNTPQPCRECVKQRVRRQRREQVDHWRAYDRQRQKTPERREQDRLRSARRRADPNTKVQRRAREILNGALAQGKISRPSVCTSCGLECVPHGHHHDYAKPLDVIWLCPQCHTGLHQVLKAMKT